jgi:hypothetical protein
MLLACETISAQLSISPGAKLSIVGNIQLTVQNMDLVNNGNLTATGGMVTFAGSNSSSISGTQPTQFFQIEIRKTNGNALKLQRAIAVTNRVLFTSGFLNLNGSDVDLGNSGHLDGEQENTRVIGPNGGAVLFNVNLNAPTNSNPANLGIFITSNQNLGNVTIRRGHQSQVIPTTNNSVLRYYDILPANNVNLNATLRFTYFNGELNGLDENVLGFYRTSDQVTWSGLGFTARDTTINFIERTGLVTFARFTVSGNFNFPLPVQFTLFNLKCESGKVLLAWKTSQEISSHHFDIERSSDAVRWATIGTEAASGNSTIEKSYAFTDNNPIQNSYYRIAQYAMDGSVQYTDVLRSACSLPEMITVYPNPLHDHVLINIVSNSASTAIIKLFDSKGALIKVQRASLFSGSNQIRMDMNSLANDAYSLYVEWNNGQMKKVVQLLKQ